MKHNTSISEECFTSETWKEIVEIVRSNLESIYSIESKSRKPSNTWSLYNAEIPDIDIDSFANINEHVAEPSKLQQIHSSRPKYQIHSKIINQLLMFMKEFLISGNYAQAKDILIVLSPIYNILASHLWPTYIYLLRSIKTFEPSIVSFLQELSVFDKKNRVAIYTELVVYLIIHEKITEAYDMATRQLSSSDFDHATTLRGLAGMLGWILLKDKESKNAKFPDALKGISTRSLLERIRTQWNAYFYLHGMGNNDEFYEIILFYQKRLDDYMYSMTEIGDNLRSSINKI